MKYFEDFKVGEVFKTRARTITEADIVNFCAFSGDWYPLHSDIEYAKKSPFGQRIAHGMLVLSATSGLMPLYDWAIVAFYGMEKVRFLNPTVIGDTLRLEMEVVETQDKGDKGGVISLDQRVKDQNGTDKVVTIMKLFVGKNNG
ncbi:MAG: MaoC/PaaZ C-terminal domain-containing protein [Thermodesulfobacteriota bacterium]|nr:MaoC/PaaZ C-terminal domain-containing protein [Thermodesulfobacteriota bacterium]